MDSIEKLRVSTFTNHQGQNIYYRNWLSGTKPKGIVLIVHGFNSHSEYYQNFADNLSQNDYEVYAIDLPGRGLSDGERYYIDDYKEIIEDIDQLVSIATAPYPTLPLFLFGHSAGGVFASVYAQLHQAKLEGLICESFAFHLPAPRFALATIKFLSRVIPHVRLIKLNNSDFSRDKSVVYKMDHDPLLANEKQPIKTMQQLLLASEYLKTKMSDIHLPLLILHGTADKATLPSGSEYFMENASSADKQLKLYEGHYHDLLNDKYNGIIFRDILRWLNERVTPFSALSLQDIQE